MKYNECASFFTERKKDRMVGIRREKARWPKCQGEKEGDYDGNTDLRRTREVRDGGVGTLRDCA